MSIAVVILTRNEALHIARAIGSVAAFATSVYVVDCGSTDDTVSIARALGAIVLHNAWISHAAQFQWALDHAGITEDWILRLDADEIIEPDLAKTILNQVPGLPADVSAVSFDRKQIFMGRWVRHGGRYPLRLVRLFRRGRGRMEQRWMDEHIVVDSGRVVHFAGGFSDHSLRDLSYFIDKHNRYATLEAVEVLNQRHQFLPRDTHPTAAIASGQARMRRRIKQQVYNRLPFPFAALGYFLFRYVVQLGFLDGRSGLVYHVLQGFWYRFLVGAKVMEWQRSLSGCTSAAEKRELLRSLTGLDL